MWRRRKNGMQPFTCTQKGLGKKWFPLNFQMCLNVCWGREITLCYSLLTPRSVGVHLPPHWLLHTFPWKERMQTEPNIFKDINASWKPWYNLRWCLETCTLSVCELIFHSLVAVPKKEHQCIMAFVCGCVRLATTIPDIWHRQPCPIKKH